MDLMFPWADFFKVIRAIRILAVFAPAKLQMAALTGALYVVVPDAVTKLSGRLDDANDGSKRGGRVDD